MIVSFILRWTTGLTLALALCGCVSDSGSGPVSPISVTASAGLAFDTVDGPPPQVFDRFVNALNSEAQALSLPTTSRETQAAYRVRAYLAAQTSRKQTSIAWVFDVYESGQRRTLRLSGEEPAGRTGRGDAWSGADEQVLRRIAQKGMADIALLMNGGRPGPTAPASLPARPTANGPAIANAGESTPTETANEPDYRSALAFGWR